jgi:TusA-related sulfurtransferase
MEKTATGREEIVTNHISAKELVSRICKETSKSVISSQKQSGHEISIDISLKRMCA